MILFRTIVPKRPKSKEDDETLQDGWTRFHQYCEKNIENCPAIFYPRKSIGVKP